MGNASTKERSASPNDSSSLRRGSRSHGEGSSSTLGRLGGEGYSSRSSRSRHNVEGSIFGGTARSGREQREIEKAAREERRRLREEERQRERERSRREESLDGGLLVTHGVYTGQEDFKDKIVRHLMIDRRLAPFWRGLRDHEDNWTDAQLYAAVHDLPIPDASAEPPREPLEKSITRPSASSDNLTVPIASRSRSHSYTSDGSGRSTPSFSFSTSRSRAKTLSISSPANPQLAATATTNGPIEINDPSRFIDGRCIEAVLYQNATECPICFLYYPPHLNRTRCCDQEICSECFVQIKRSDPHIPEHHDGPPPTDSVAEQLISVPASCPFCKQPDFGVTYQPLPWRRGLQYATSSINPSGVASPFSIASNSSSISLSSTPASPSRRTMIPLGSPEVVTSDDIRPDWSAKLQAARTIAMRRAAAATALHTAAFMTVGSSAGGSTSSRRSFIRRGLSGSNSIPGAAAAAGGTAGAAGAGAAAAALRVGSVGSRSTRAVPETMEEGLANLGFTGRRRQGNNRLQDLEEIMFLEAVRLSLEEEERKKREEEEKRRKEAEKAGAGAEDKAEAKGKGVVREGDEVGESSKQGQEDKGKTGVVETAVTDRVGETAN
ncbi:Similar to Protein SIP5; acc. no. Q0UJC3 [Pyronema omphalodes CBS 100304]|uniref:Similar to Protein SIP5 acc. no. Q0UJC3 n=1 Tax=Pyronema omphalodes (strain CBS 100304) TaxID=1076935 RepID=U4LC11_PYROM|nr:Similar to Protein SIP5; acc. no. Q0UJC3 [Pyronema omphalodes CBS 100304]